MSKTIDYIIRLLVILVLFLIASCRSKHSNAIDAIFNLSYRKQVIIDAHFLNDEESVTKLGITYAELYYKNEDLNFSNFYFINVNYFEKGIWVIKLAREEKINEILQTVSYFVFIRKKDGALLYIRREFGEWVGTTESYLREIKN